MTTGEKIRQLRTVETLGECEAAFLDSVSSQSANGEDAAFLTRSQVEFVNRLHEKHFGD